MSLSDFVHFVSANQAIRTRAYDGYLSFLTDPLQEARQAAMTHLLDDVFNDFYTAYGEAMQKAVDLVKSTEIFNKVWE